MRFLTDQDVYAMTAQLLQNLGHNVAAAAELGLSRATDATLLRTAKVQERIFVTRDRDFGNLVFVDQLATGVVYLRMLPSSLAAVHAELERVLERYGQDALLHSFIVVQPGRHRLRRLPEVNTGEEGA
jgi:predicted nuclease of predicted toxin-antitoxin system